MRLSNWLALDRRAPVRISAVVRNFIIKRIDRVVGKGKRKRKMRKEKNLRFCFDVSVGQRGGGERRDCVCKQLGWTNFVIADASKSCVNHENVVFGMSIRRGKKPRTCELRQCPFSILKCH